MAAIILTPRQRDAFNRIGDIMLPRDGDYPGFAELGCIEHAEVILAHAPADDVKSLQGLLNVLSYMPNAVLRVLVWLTQKSSRAPEPLGTPLRLLDLGLRSVVVSLYYSGRRGKGYTGPTPLQLMGYDLNIVLPRDSA